MEKIDERDIAPQVLKQIQQGAFLVVKAGSQLNVMTIGWATLGVIWKKSTMMVAVRNSRFTFGLIEKADSFAVSVPTGDMTQEINFCGTKSGRDIDKLKECRFNPIAGKLIGSPILNLPGFHYECRIVYKTPMDPRFIAPDLEPLYPKKDYHTLYFGEILACSQIGK